MPSVRSFSLSNAIRLALVCEVCIPRKNSSTVAQCVIDSIYVNDGSNCLNDLNISFISYMHIL